MRDRISRLGLEGLDAEIFEERLDLIHETELEIRAEAERRARGGG